MKQVEIFKTGVCRANEAESVVNVLLKCFPHYQINFDLDDCDKVLRVVSEINVSMVLVEQLGNLGFTAKVMEIFQEETSEINGFVIL